MAIDIADNFNNREGQLFNYDVPIGYSTTIRDQLITNSHIDFRRFDNASFTRRRTQLDLNDTPQSSLNNLTQDQIENVSIANGESWITNAPGPPSVTVGALTQFDNWHGLRMVYTTTSSGTLFVRSGIATTSAPGIDLSGMDFFSFILPEYHTFIDATSTVILTSHPTGGTQLTGGWDSVVVPFGHSIAPTDNEIRFDMSEFGVAGANWKPSSVTGILITMNPTTSITTGTAVTIMGMRAAKNNWRPQTLDINTLTGAVESVPTLTGADPTPAEAFQPVVRGEPWSVSQGKTDPQVIDGTLSMAFQVNHLTYGTNGVPNLIDLIFRERRDTTANTGSLIRARLKFYSGAASASTFRENFSGTVSTVSGSTITYNTVPALTTGKWYVFQAYLNNQTLVMNIYNSNENGVLLDNIWDSTDENVGANSNYTREQGRLGWYASLPDRDTRLDNFNANAISFSLIRTVPITSDMPVIGAQLKASYSLDSNLFSNFEGGSVDNGGIFVDTSKTFSSDLSYRSQLPIQSNPFYVEDWNQMYLKFYIWVPNQMTTENQPYISLKSNDALVIINLPKPALQPNIWNLVEVDLSQLQGNPTGVFYAMYIESGENVKTPYPWYIDNSVVIGRRNVSWQVRANPSAPWREFRDSVNDNLSGVHFPPEERGTEFQVQVVGLTDSAWVSGWTVKRIFAQLGKPTYYN